MITYSLIWMGPAYLDWYEDNNIDYIEEPHPYGGVVRKYTTTYCAGRIEVKVDGFKSDVSYAVGVMTSESWEVLAGYLRGTCGGLETDILLTKEELLNRCEMETNHKLQYLN